MTRCCLIASALALSCGQDAVTPTDRVAPAPRPDQLFQDTSAFADVNSLGPSDVGAISLADLDHDGVDDLILPGNDATRLFRNRGDGSFVAWGSVAHPGRRVLTVYAADVTQDGRLDLVMATVKTFLVFRGVSDGVYEPIDGLPSLEGGGYGSVVTFGDFAHTGRLGLFLGRSFPFQPGETSQAETLFEAGCASVGVDPSTLEPVPSTYLAADASSFVDRTATVGLDVPAKVQATAAADINDDGHLDLFVGTEGGARDLVFLNDGAGHFTESGEALGWDARTSAMGFDMADIDGDGDAEFFVADAMPDDGGIVWVRQPDGRFQNEAAERGLLDTAQFSSWGGGFHDFDHDGDVDLLLANSLPPEGGSCDVLEQERLYFRNDGTGHFERVVGAVGTALDAISEARAAQVSDLDADGDLDVVVASLDGPPQVLRNDMATGAWLLLDLDYPFHDPAVGAIVRVRADGKTFTRWVIGTPSWGGSGSHVVHVGLGEAKNVEGIDVVWPSGQTQAFPGGPARERRRLTFAP